MPALSTAHGRAADRVSVVPGLARSLASALPGLIRSVAGAVVVAVGVAGLGDATAATAATAAPASIGEGGDRQASLSATLLLRDLDGGVLETVQGGEPFRLEVRLSDATMTTAPRGIELAGWLRRAEPGRASCRDAARAFRVTHRLSRDAIDLNGILIAQLNTDASLGVVDPSLDLSSSNMVAASRFDQAPADFTIDSRRQLALASFADQGEVRAVTLLDGRERPLVRALARPGPLAVLADGQTWVLEQAPMALVRFDARGDIVDRLALGAGDFRLLRDRQRLIAWSPSGRIVVVDSPPGGPARPVAFDVGAPVIAAALAGSGALLTLDDDGLTARLRFLDAPDQFSVVPLRASATALSATGDSAHAFAWSSEHGGVSVIEIATARQVTGFAADQPFGEVAFGPGQAWFLVDDRSLAFTLDLASLGLGKTPALRATPLGKAVTPGSPAATPGSRHLVPLLPSPQALAVNPDAGTAFVLEQMLAIGSAPPMNRVRLRGGVVRSIEVLDRSLREQAPGLFATHVRIDRPGLHELVLTTGIGGMSTCLPVQVDGTDDRPAPLALQLQVSGPPVLAGQRQQLHLALVDRDGRAYSVDHLAVLMPSLVSPWSGRARAQRDASGRLMAEVTFPHPGAYALQPLLPAHHRVSIAPTTIVVQHKLPGGEQ